MPDMPDAGAGAGMGQPAAPPEGAQPPTPQPAGGDESSSQLRQMIMQIGQFAQTAPEASQELQMAAKALTAAMVKLASGQRTQPPGMMPIGS